MGESFSSFSSSASASPGGGNFRTVQADPQTRTEHSQPAFRILLRDVSPELRPRDLRELTQRTVDAVTVREESQDARLPQLVVATFIDGRLHRDYARFSSFHRLEPVCKPI